MSAITDRPPGLLNRLLWFFLIWAASVVSVASAAFLLKWLVFTP